MQSLATTCKGDRFTFKALLCIAFFTALLVQTGGLGSLDTGRRLQIARSFWAREPAVSPAGSE